MKTATLSDSRLAEIIAGFADAKIAIVGDFFLDKYLDVDPAFEEISVETSLAAHQVTNIRCAPGAAGTVVRNLHSLGAGTLLAIGFTGDDGEGFDLRKELKRLDCDTSQLFIDTERYTPTYLKPRNANIPGLGGEHSRYDTKNRTKTPPAIEDRIIQALEQTVANVDAVIVLDQVHEAQCGVVTRKIREAIARLAANPPQTYFWADSRRLIHEFRNVIIKPNQFEAAGIDCPLPDDEVELSQLLERGRQLHAENNAPVVITRGQHGMLVSDPEWTVVPGVHITGETDPTGAGDSATAGTVLALCAGATLDEAALVGNLVASITIQQLATTGTATPAEVAERLKIWQQQQNATH